MRGGTPPDDPWDESPGRLRATMSGEHMGPEYQTTVDGLPVDYVRVLDVNEGWVLKNCEHPAHGDAPHVDPETEEGPCERYLFGNVEVWSPDGEKVDVSERPWNEEAA